MSIARTLLLVCTVFLAACQHTPKFVEKDGEFCRIVRHSLELEFPGDTREVSFHTAVSTALRQRPGPMLFLSGGSQHGAFGAGFLNGWNERERENGRNLPDFTIVTGVSTGALQSTGAFIGQPMFAVEGYTIANENEILEKYVPGSALRNGIGFFAALTAVRKGAVSDLVPLRGRLARLIDDFDALGKVAREAARGRKLYVGATDVDTGTAVAFDMTELASRYAAARQDGNAAEADRLKGCYVEALIASSIVPPAAKPVFIDNRMYIDGGVKYAVFAEDIGRRLDLADGNAGRAAIRAMSVAPAATTPPQSAYILLNGDGETEAQCGKKDDQLCEPGTVDWELAGRHKDWSFPGMALRAVDLLINQVTRLSIDRAIHLEREPNTTVYFARIDKAEKDSFRADLGAPFEPGTFSCAEWREKDRADRAVDPMEFHPRYMRCLIRYGFERGKAFDWDSIAQPAPTAAE